MKAAIFVGTLKKGDDADENSKTLALARRVADRLDEEEVEVRLIRLADMDPPNEKGPPPWGAVKQEIINEAFDADIVMMATPIWWNNHSSLIQRLIEYLDDVNDVDIERTNSKDGTRAGRESSFAGKLFGCIVVGAEDGSQHVAGNLFNAANWLGFMIPPTAGVTDTRTRREEVDAMIERTVGSLISGFRQ